MGLRRQRRPAEAGAEVEGRERETAAANRQAAALMARRAETGERVKRRLLGGFGEHQRPSG